MGVAAPDTPYPNLGLQMFSIRNLVSSLGFQAVFQELADIGFKDVEFAGYTSPASPGLTIAGLRGLLDANGLRAVGAHQNLNAVLGLNGAAAQMQEFENARTLGMTHVGSGALFPSMLPSNTVSDIQRIAEQYNTAGAAAATMGLKVYGHNHDGEFAFTTDNPARRKYDVLVENITHPNAVIEMDIYWAYVGAARFPGFNPPDYVVSRPQRFALFHVKDGNVVPGGTGSQILEFGQGNIPFRAFFDAVGARSYHYPLWEQDTAPNTPAALGGAAGAARRSYDNMHAVRTLTWLDELGQMIASFAGAGRLNMRVAASLEDRRIRAAVLVESGSETRATAYLEQLIARANNQIRGDADDIMIRSLIVAASQQIVAWLAEAEDRENKL
ncbi:sugar phosphate isomerase/epimerase [Motilibacter sp. E257]|uniref:Sugar phosphate isomerase/epimerase n=2 Tax=Motilibacter deserti TaxID=2714956 RepID=A0ABX0GPS2_9ACTN|nr:sugar phosphate isomerase/epimerase [Motilibacter deserti]